jgi:hypothetical protein
MAEKDRAGDAVELIPFQLVMNEPEGSPGTGGTGITRDGNFRKILACSSLNFHMLDKNEQRTVLDIWCELLDNLDFPIQLLSHSKQLDPSAFVRQFEDRLKNPKLDAITRHRLEDQIRHQRARVVAGRLLNREFYIVIPFRGEDKSLLERPTDHLPVAAFARELLNKAERGEKMPIDYDAIDTAEIALNRRVNFVRSALLRMRIESHPLQLQEMQRLFFEMFHPSRSEQHPLGIDDWGGNLFPQIIEDDD